DGPPENGGNGTEFSPPRRILTELGCIDGRTLISTNDGLMYRSWRGIEKLSRNFTVEWIGERVKRTVDTFKFSGGAAFDVVSGRCFWLLGRRSKTAVSFQDIYPGQLRPDYTTDGFDWDIGVAVVYHSKTDAWSTYKYKVNSSSSYVAFPMQDICWA